MPRWTARTWREWLFEVFAPSGPIPFNPLPITDAERRERAERASGDVLKDITRLNLSDPAQPSPRE